MHPECLVLPKHPHRVGRSLHLLLWRYSRRHLCRSAFHRLHLPQEDTDIDERIVHTAKRSLVIKQAVKELRSYYMHLGLDNPGLTRAARLPHPTYAVASEAVQATIAFC